MRLCAPAPPASNRRLDDAAAISSPAVVRGPVIHNVQVLRFLAAAGVVLSHAADLLIAHSPEHAWFWAVPWRAGVDLFFVISGFIMAVLARDAFGVPGAAAHFLKRRILRIAPPYWFFTTVTVLVVLALGGKVGGTTVDLPQLVTSYGFVPWPRADGKLNPILSQGWTLNYEAFFYAAFAASLLARRGRAALCIAFPALALANPIIPPEWFVLKFWSHPIILEFVGGILLANLYLGGIRLSRMASLACAASAVLVFLATAGLNLGTPTHFVHAGIPALLLCAGLLLAPEPARVGALGQWVRRGGDASYTLYLSHYMIVHAMVMLWKKAGIGLPWLGVAAAVLCALLFSLLFFRIVERPVTDALQRRFGRRRPNELELVAP